MARRLVVAMAAALIWLLGWAPQAGADAAAPTDYRSTVRSITPPVDGLSVEVVGGDSFLLLINRSGYEVLVPGYQDEPYLRFRADGTVEENRSSPTTALNASRLPARSADPTRATDAALIPATWTVVATDGRYAWHDHRTHWMSPLPPLGRQRGDEILDGTVPITVDGRPVEVRVSVVWEPAPSPVPVLLGAAAALVLLAVPARRLASRPTGAATVAKAAAAAALVASWQARSLPAQASPSLMRTLLPTAALLLAGLALAGAHLARRASPLARQIANWVHAMSLLAALELVVWAWLRRSGMWKAVLPTDANPAFDRFVTSLCLVVGVGAGALAVLALASGPRAAAPAKATPPRPTSASPDTDR